MLKKQKVEFLQNMPVFGGIDQNTLDWLITQGSYFAKDKGEYLFTEGEECGSMYVIESGSVLITKKWKNKEYVLKKLITGDCIGEMAMLELCLRPRSASAFCLEHTKVIKISYCNLMELFAHNQEQFTIFQMNMGREVSRRLREMDKKLFELQVECSYAKVFTELNEYLSSDFGALTNENS